MDILLSHGYFLSEDPIEQQIMKPYPPLGILYLSSFLRSRGFEVEVVDNTFAERDDFYHHLNRLKPPLVGLYANLLTRSSVVKIIEECRNIGSTVVVGGPDPANYAEQYLRQGADYVVIGEGEDTLAELLSVLSGMKAIPLDKVEGIVFVRNGQVIRTKARARLRDLDELPLPDRNAIDIPGYMEVWRTHHGMGAVSLITSRGCPYTYSWCSHSVFGYSYRSRSPERVVDEVEEVIAAYKPDLLWYADDVFTMNHKWLRQYSNELDRRGLKVPFETITREDRLDDEVVQILAHMKCHRLWIGSESGSQKVLDAMRRRTNVERVKEVVRLVKDYGIQTGMFIMLGYESESKRDIELTLELLKACDPDVFLTTVAYPIKGTPYYETVAGRVIERKPWAKGSDRDFTVEGRYSQRFYRYAARWLVSEMKRHQSRKRGRGGLLGNLRNLCSAKLGRVGMMLSQFERES